MDKKGMLFSELTLLVLVPDPDQPVVLSRRGENCPVGRVGQVAHGVGRAGLPQAAPVHGRRSGGVGREVGPTWKETPMKMITKNN